MTFNRVMTVAFMSLVGAYLGLYLREIQVDQQWNNIEERRLKLDREQYEFELRRDRECSK